MLLELSRELDAVLLLQPPKQLVCLPTHCGDRGKCFAQLLITCVFPSLSKIASICQPADIGADVSLAQLELERLEERGG